MSNSDNAAGNPINNPAANNAANIMNRLNPSQQILIQSLSGTLKASGLFTEVGLQYDNANSIIYIYAKPKYIYEDMIEELDKDKDKEIIDNFSYAMEMPNEDFILSNKEIDIRTSMLAVGFTVKYLQGNRKIFKVNFAKEEIVENTTKAPTEEVAKKAG